ncbi:MAG: hypothetical protein R6V03_03905 [Kiritimatiellia bacterium]
MKITGIVLSVFTIVLCIIPSFTAGAEPELPPELPEYYAPQFEIQGKPLNLIENSATNNMTRWVYTTDDGTQALVLELADCRTMSSDMVFNNILVHMAAQMRNDQSRFREIADTEICAQVSEENISRSIFTYKLPDSVQIWTFSVKPGARPIPKGKFEAVRSAVDRQRYEDARRKGNVSMGAWSPRIHHFAMSLLDSGKKTEAVAVYKTLLAASPYNYKAHLEFAGNTKDAYAAKNSAEIVLANAEDPELVADAAELLGKQLTEYDSIPLLKEKEKGLQVILIPLEPCEVWLLDDVAEIYREMTGVPVKIRRLKKEWHWSKPDRIAQERTIRKAIVRIKKKEVDFTGWSKEQYVDVLNFAARSENALSRYYIGELIDKINRGPGQYFVDPYLDRLCKIREQHGSTDKRTMYVGITRANIYSGDNNYLFSLGRIKGKYRSSILSYHMMLADNLGEEYESRERLTQRIAKELVPASFKQLNIPRSTDPRCPYSYSSGVARLDQKSLKLAAPVKNALKDLKAGKE